MPLLIATLSRWTARIVAVGCLLAAVGAQAQAPLLKWTLAAEYPRDASGFTQGLVWHEGRLFHSDGQYGASRVTEAALKTGKVLRSTPLPSHHFGEGLALHAGALWQLTWREGVLHRYDLSLQPTGTLRYGGEGWGLTSDGTGLIISNGSTALTWIDPLKPAVLRHVEVRDGKEPISRLNELEWVDGVIYANVWMTDRIARIDAQTGQVTGWLDLSTLKQKAGITPEQEAQGAVLNGIAWRADQQQLLVTGKYWPKIYALKLLAAPAAEPASATRSRPASLAR